MYLGSAEILRRIKEERLLDCNLVNVQGSGVDLEIDRLFQLVSNSFLSRVERRLPELGEIKDKIFILKPNKYYLCTTKERVNMPSDLVAFIFPRSTLFRCGISIRSAVVDPGYNGTLTIGIKNETEFDFSLERGSRIAQIVFSKVWGKTANYSGKYQGGKVK